jgi:FkbM family methyltransferase
MSYENLPEWDAKIEQTIRENVSAVLPHIPDNGVIIDVGGNTGMFTRLVLENKPDIRAIIFEPIKELSKYCRSKLIDYPFVSCFNYALSDVEGREIINCGRKNLGWNTMLDVTNEDNQSNRRYAECRVFDNIGLHIPRLDLVKIDVEGYEYRVLRGMMKTIEKHKPVILCEIGFGNKHPAWNDEKEVFECIFNMGYGKICLDTITGTKDIILLPEGK